MSIEGKALGYFMELRDAQQGMDLKPLGAAIELIRNTLGRIYVAGNGGSASISDHLCCDFTKGTYSPESPGIKTYSLVSNTAMLTALANDFSYEDSLSKQIEMYATPTDLLILISSSGNSVNVVRACQAAQAKWMKVIALTGFNGGKLAQICDVNLHVPSTNYGIVEDTHQSLMHIMSQLLKAEGVAP